LTGALLRTTLRAVSQRDLLKAFRAPTWKHEGQAARFVEAAKDVSSDDLVRLLKILVVAKPSPGEAVAQRNRANAFAALVRSRPDPALFRPIAQALKSTDGGIRSRLADLLTVVNNPSQHDELCELMRTGDLAQKRLAAKLLVDLGDRRTVQALGEVVAGAPFEGRIGAIDALVAIGAARSLPFLSAVLENGTPAERLHVLELLAKPDLVGNHVGAVLKRLQRSFIDADPRVVAKAISTFSRVCSESEWFRAVAPFLDSPNLPCVRAAIQGMRRFPSARTVRALQRSFQLGPHTIRMAVIAVCGEIESEVVLPVLVEALHRKELTLRNRAAEALARLHSGGKVRVEQTLIWLLKSRDPDVRRMAVDLAGKIQDKGGRIWPRLLELLRDEDWWVRERVVDVLVSLAGTELTRHVVSYLQDASDVVRRYAIGVLTRLKDPAALGALVRAATDDADWWVRETAIHALGTLGDARAVPYLVDLMNKQVEARLVCLDALSQLGAGDAAGAIALLVESEDDSEVRLLGLRCLAALDAAAIRGTSTAELAERLSPLVADPDRRVREQAQKLLAGWNFTDTDRDIGLTIEQSLGRLDRLLCAAAEAGADDLLLAADQRPHVKLRGQVKPFETGELSAKDVEEMLFGCLSAEQQDALRRLQDLDLSYEIKNENLRFRANIYQQSTGLAAVFRVIRRAIPTLEQLDLPEAVVRLADLEQGLVLVGGPVGSGKSTTLAALIDSINTRSASHIITLEDPIEFIHLPKRSIITQREVGRHSRSYAAALRAMLRQDPDVILIGEMRDAATIALAVTAAETGHMVFGTVHTSSADATIDRLVNTFPSGQQAQVRSVLASTLRAIVCQHLLRRIDRPGRALALEVLINNDAIANLIRKGRTFQIPSVMTLARASGMQSMDAELQRLVREGRVSFEEAYMKANSKVDFEAAIGDVVARPPSRRSEPPTLFPADGSNPAAVP
jgi:twitching motility protein PilT